MTRTVLLAVLALLAVPGAALASPVKISPRASAVSAAGVATVEVANPNRAVLKGTASVTAGGRTIATRSVKLGRLSVATIKLSFSSRAVAALRSAGGKATIRLKLRRSGRTMTARRTLTLRLPAEQPAPGAPAPGTGDPAGGTPTPAGGTGTGTQTGGQQPAPPASNRWVGRMGTEGAYDDLEFTLDGTQLQLTKTPFVPVSCFENGGSYRSALSFELFTAPGPWTVGSDGSVAKQGIAVNQLVGSSSRTVTYKLTDSTRTAAKVTGTLGMSFSDSKYDVFSKTITFINCAGAQSFEAVPAP